MELKNITFPDGTPLDEEVIKFLYDFGLECINAYVKTYKKGFMKWVAQGCLAGVAVGSSVLVSQYLYKRFKQKKESTK